MADRRDRLVDRHEFADELDGAWDYSERVRIRDTARQVERGVVGRLGRVEWHVDSEHFGRLVMFD